VEVVDMVDVDDEDREADDDEHAHEIEQCLE